LRRCRLESGGEGERGEKINPKFGVHILLLFHESSNVCTPWIWGNDFLFLFFFFFMISFLPFQEESLFFHEDFVRDSGGKKWTKRIGGW